MTDEMTDELMQAREAAIRRWFAMWLQKADLGMDALFAEDVCYIESWGPVYHGRAAVKHWFAEWNTRGTVLQWTIAQCMHREAQTVVVWRFVCAMQGEAPSGFDGVSWIRWTPQGQIAFLQEFACSERRYDPYRADEAPANPTL